MLESILSVKPFLDVSRFRDRLALLEGQVCRIEVGGTALGTGFLVDTDRVLTGIMC